MYLMWLSILLCNVSIEAMNKSEKSVVAMKVLADSTQRLLNDYVDVQSRYNLQAEKDSVRWQRVLSMIRSLPILSFNHVLLKIDEKKALIQQEQDQAVQALLSLRSMPVDKLILPSKSFSAGAKKSRKKKTPDVIVIDKHKAM